MVETKAVNPYDRRFGRDHHLSRIGAARYLRVASKIKIKIREAGVLGS